MLLSLNWLQDFVEIPISARELAEKLTMSGIEVDEIIEIGSQWDNIVVGEVIEHAAHPNADKLSVNRVNAGDQTYDVVCGAPNVKAGQKVPLALVGAVFPSGLAIKRSKIRGQVSEGMICSATELCIGHDASGILVLDDDMIPGTGLADALGLRDTVLNLGLTPNRSDCMSVIGMAREVSALLDIPIKIPACDFLESGSEVRDFITVRMDAPHLCPRYTARYAYDITVAPSPRWMQRRLEACGIRSINNIVDITNYVLLEWGQPMHAFDYSTLAGETIIVRTSARGETFTTLDSVEHKLPTDTLMICDNERPVALAGIMGGLNSGVTDTTDRVLLESAYFVPGGISATGRALSIKTESSQRFEKGVDIQGIIPALNRAAALLVELGAGKIARGLLDSYPEPLPAPLPISVSVNKINRTLGLSLEPEDIASYLCRLQMSVSFTDADRLAIEPPTFRYDLKQPVDIIEEVARMHGYNLIPVTYPAARLTAYSHNKSHRLSSIAKSVLTAAGLGEVINYSFQDPAVITSLAFDKADPRSTPIPLLNPLSAAQSVMRPTIVGSLLQNLKDNVQHNSLSALNIFEISNVFNKSSDDAPAAEKRMIAGLCYGVRHGACWNLPDRAADFFDVKGAVEALLAGFAISTYSFAPHSKEPFLHPHASMELFIDGTLCGSLGTLHPDIADAFEIDGDVHIFELDFDRVCSYYSDARQYVPFSRYPAVHRDLALIVDDSVNADAISASIAGYKNNILKGFKIFDYYQGKSIAAGKKSIAYRLTFQSDERTLTDSEVNKVHDKLLVFLRKQHGAELR